MIISLNILDEIETVHYKFSDKKQSMSVQKSEIRSKMNVFERATKDEIIFSSSSKSCDLDSIPTSMALKNCLDILITPTIHIIAFQCKLQVVHFRKISKELISDYYLKKPSLRPEKKFCLLPISDRPYQNMCDPNLFYRF